MKDNLVRTVVFMDAQRGLYEDLYRCNETSRVFIRQECDDAHVRWLTASKWIGGYEADCHLKDGLMLRAVKKDGSLLFKERITQTSGVTGTWAQKKAPFSWEAIAALADKYRKQLNLRSYEDWKGWLMTDAKAAGFTGCRENWLFAMSERAKPEKIAQLDYLGKSAYAVVQEETHKVCGKKWFSYEIQSADLYTCLAICGYKFEEGSA